MLFHKYTDGQYKQFGQGIRCVFAMFPIIYVHCPICFLAFLRAKLSPITTSAYHQVKSIFSSKIMCICTTSCLWFQFCFGVLCAKTIARDPLGKELQERTMASIDSVLDSQIIDISKTLLVGWVILFNWKHCSCQRVLDNSEPTQ